MGEVGQLRAVGESGDERRVKCPPGSYKRYQLSRESSRFPALQCEHNKTRAPVSQCQYSPRFETSDGNRTCRAFASPFFAPRRFARFFHSLRYPQRLLTGHAEGEDTKLNTNVRPEYNVVGVIYGWMGQGQEE
jgi:hypothetical protein